MLLWISKYEKQHCFIPQPCSTNRNAVRSGFIPAWVEMTVKPITIVDEMYRSRSMEELMKVITDIIK